MGKYGTNLEGFGAFEGGVNADKGAPLISTSSDGETALLFGPAALREIQAGVANGDFAIPPDAAGDTITEANPLPYFTFTDVNSAGAITCAVVADAAAPSGNLLRWSVAASTASGKSAKITRFVPVASSVNRAFTYIPEITVSASATTATVQTRIRMQYFKLDQTTSTGIERTDAVLFVNGTQTLKLTATEQAEGDAAFLLITVEIETLGTTPASVTTNNLFEINLYVGGQVVIVSDEDAGTGPSLLTQFAGALTIDPPLSLEITKDTAVTGDLTASGSIIGSGVTEDLVHGITLQRTTNLTVNTSLDASATAITWSSAVKNTTLRSYWSSGSTIAIPLTGWYSITCHLISGTGLGTGFAFRLYALVGGTVIAETETQAGANTTSDTFSIATIAYLTAGNSLVFRASASAASKTIGGSGRSRCSIVYLGDMSA